MNTAPATTASAYLNQVCERDISRLASCRWITAAGSDQLPTESRTAWGLQDIMWGELYGQAMAIARDDPDTPPAATAAFGWLSGNSDREGAFLRQMADGPAPAGADELWADFTGYGCYTIVSAQQGLPEAMTVAWAGERAYQAAFQAVTAADPKEDWAQFSGPGNWGGEGFAGMMRDMSDGLDIAVGPLAALPRERLHGIEKIATTIFRFEFACWDSLYDLKRWPE
jgi:hypothetical protein